MADWDTTGLAGQPDMRLSHWTHKHTVHTQRSIHWEHDGILPTQQPRAARSFAPVHNEKRSEVKIVDRLGSTTSRPAQPSHHGSARPTESSYVVEGDTAAEPHALLRRLTKREAKRSEGRMSSRSILLSLGPRSQPTTALRGPPRARRL